MFWRYVFAFALLISGGFSYGSVNSTEINGAIQRGRSFLTNLVEAELNLLPEFPGSKVYWLFHDNYLAAKVLSSSHPEIAEKISAAIHREGVTNSGKIELLFGEAESPLPFRHYQLKEVRRIGDKIIRTEVVTDRKMIGWEAYADLLLLASISEKNPVAAHGHWKAALQLWDGNGFLDPATRQHQIYSTYKLALAVLAARHLSPPESVPENLLERLLTMQANSGGWITDYALSGKKVGQANVETTSLAILALEASLVSKSAKAKPGKK
ncbi:MAG TPA: hypothetical protein VK633_07515 [Verrucomicrobiae bacterium]|nr:hypothetical protein [Verrucomicrobiae bacterium]